MNIRQCIPADRAKASAFLEELPQKPAILTAPFALAMSLIAEQAEETQGLALCYPVAGTQVHELFIAASPKEPALVQSLINKALTKLHAQGIHKCKVTVVHGDESQDVWNQSRWAGTMSEPVAQIPAKKKSKPRKAKASAAAA